MSHTVPVNASKVVVVTENHGGYKGGRCVACDAIGWLDNEHGYPSHVKGVLGNKLKHKKSCPMNSVLNDNGTLKKVRQKSK
jgi:hypothetical protein